MTIEVQTLRDFETDCVVVRSYVRFRQGDRCAMEVLVSPRAHPDGAPEIERIKARNDAAAQFEQAVKKAMSVFVAEMKSHGAEMREVPADGVIVGYGQY